MPLADIAFTDLYINSAGDQPFLKLSTEGPIAPIPPEMMEEVQKLLVMMTTKLGDKREFSLTWGGVTYRVAKIEALDGIWFTLRRGPSRVPRVDELGMHPMLMNELVQLGKKQGLLVVCGKTGAGKTWTAASVFKSWMEFHGDVGVTIEDPPELPLNGWNGKGRCFQIMVPEKEFGSALVASMRYTPRYIMLGEIRSPAAAREALRASINGHVVITTLHAGSVEEALHRIVDLACGEEGGNRSSIQTMLSEGIAGVLHQKLVDSGNNRRLDIRFMFPAFVSGDPMRALIRDGKVEQLGTCIEAQTVKMFNRGKMALLQQDVS
ncbi:MAG: ATPase, T2SS/T4P/T4SS family [Alphaproteobacteria bacterium]